MQGRFCATALRLGSPSRSSTAPSKRTSSCRSAARAHDMRGARRNRGRSRAELCSSRRVRADSLGSRRRGGRDATRARRAPTRVERRAARARFWHCGVRRAIAHRVGRPLLHARHLAARRRVDASILLREAFAFAFDLPGRPSEFARLSSVSASSESISRRTARQSSLGAAEKRWRLQASMTAAAPSSSSQSALASPTQSRRIGVLERSCRRALDSTSVAISIAICGLARYPASRMQRFSPSVKRTSLYRRRSASPISISAARRIVLIAIVGASLFGGRGAA